VLPRGVPATPSLQWRGRGEHGVEDDAGVTWVASTSLAPPLLSVGVTKLFCGRHWTFLWASLLSLSLSGRHSGPLAATLWTARIEACGSLGFPARLEAPERATCCPRLLAPRADLGTSPRCARLKADVEDRTRTKTRKGRFVHGKVRLCRGEEEEHAVH